MLFLRPLRSPCGSLPHTRQALHPFLPPLADLALQCAKHQQAGVRVGGLKVLGALMAAREDLFTVCGAKYLDDAFRVLSGIAAMDSDRGAQQLAEGLVRVFAPLQS